MVNTEKLKKRIWMRGMTQRECAGALRLKESTFNRKLNNARPFSLSQARALARALGISDRQFGGYFFADELPERRRGDA